MMAETMYNEAIALLGRAIQELPEHRVELLAEWAEVLETTGKAQAEQAGLTDPIYFQEALAKYRTAIEAALADNSPLLSDLHFDHGQLCSHIAESRYQELGSGTGAYAASCHIVLATVVRPYLDRACMEFRFAVQASKGTNTVMQERLGDVCFVNARISGCDAHTAAQLLAEAEHWYRTAMTADPEDDEVVARLAQLYFHQRRFEECTALLVHWQALGGRVPDLRHEDRIFTPEFVLYAAAFQYSTEMRT